MTRMTYFESIDRKAIKTFSTAMANEQKSQFTMFICEYIKLSVNGLFYLPRQ